MFAALPHVMVAALLAAPVFASTVPPAATTLAAQSLRELGELSIEELSQIEVTSASRRPESLSEVTSAIYVITGDDIRRSGAATLAEALRLAPNLEVARINSPSSQSVTPRFGRYLVPSLRSRPPSLSLAESCS